MEQATVAAGSTLLTKVNDAVHDRVVGQNEAVEGLLVALLTGGHILLEGLPGLAKTLMVRTLAQAMAKEYAADGIHVGHVVVDGAIGGDKIISGLPAYAERLGEEGMISIEGIVDGYVFLYRQPPRAWTFEIDVRTSKESW